MDCKYKYWHFISALDDNVVDKILSAGKKKLADEGGKAKISDNSKVGFWRKSNVCWFNEQWLYDLLWPYLTTANENAGWNFDLDWSESCQFTKYKEGQFYGWHSDSYPKPYNDEKGKELEGKIRKLSMTVSLNDPNEYEGGNLEFDFRHRTDYEFTKSDKALCTEIRPQGSVIVFPSFVWHRVAPVTKGTRYSLVIWNLGYPFR